MDQGVRFFRCDFQVHTPRDRAWKGPDAITAEERDRYASEFVAACRERALHAVAITDHHCMTFPPYMRAAVARGLAEDGTALEAGKRLVVFRGIGLTLGVPCQAIIIFDADFADELFPVVMTVLAMSQNDATESKVCSTVRLNTTTTSGDLKAKLDEHLRLRGRYILLPNVTDEGQHSLLRSGQQGKYIDMLCVGATRMVITRSCALEQRARLKDVTLPGVRRRSPASRPPTRGGRITGRWVSHRPGSSSGHRWRAPQDSNLRPSGSKPDTLSS